MSRRKVRRARTKRLQAKMRERPWHKERTNWYAISLFLVLAVILGLLATSGEIGRGPVFFRGARY